MGRVGRHPVLGQTVIKVLDEQAEGDVGDDQTIGRVGVGHRDVFEPRNPVDHITVGHLQVSGGRDGIEHGDLAGNGQHLQDNRATLREAGGEVGKGDAVSVCAGNQGVGLRIERDDHVGSGTRDQRTAHGGQRDPSLGLRCRPVEGIRAHVAQGVGDVRGRERPALVALGDQSGGGSDAQAVGRRTRLVEDEITRLESGGDALTGGKSSQSERNTDLKVGQSNPPVVEHFNLEADRGRAAIFPHVEERHGHPVRCLFPGGRAAGAGVEVLEQGRNTGKAEMT